MILYIRFIHQVILIITTIFKVSLIQLFSQHKLLVLISFSLAHYFHFYTKMRSGDSTTIDVPESSAVAKGKAPLVAIVKQEQGKGGWKRGVAIFDFLLRLGAIITTLAAAATMGTSDETLPFFTQFFQFQASYDDLPTFQCVIFRLSLSISIHFMLKELFHFTKSKL